MLKSRCMAYDGKGNVVIRDAGDIEAAISKLRSIDISRNKSSDDEAALNLYAEKWVPFCRELAVMVVNSSEGCWAYECVETRQVCLPRDNVF